MHAARQRRKTRYCIDCIYLAGTLGSRKGDNLSHWDLRNRETRHFVGEAYPYKTRV